jgi:hypothetical protein
MATLIASLKSLIFLLTLCDILIKSTYPNFLQSRGVAARVTNNPSNNLRSKIIYTMDYGLFPGAAIAGDEILNQFRNSSSC